MNSETHLNNIRKLIIALTASGILNILFFSGMIYWMFKETTPTTYFEHKPALQQEQQAPLAAERGIIEQIHFFRSLSFEQLVDELSNTQLIENGYSQRDIALASLVGFHHLDLTRALVGQILPNQQRSIVYGRLKNGEPATLSVYPGLSDQQFQAIIDFISTERWPLTSKGLFWAMKRQGHQADSTLFDAFAMTPEFQAVELLFNRADTSISQKELQNMLLDGTWNMISEFSEKQKGVQDLSPARRQHFLLGYIDRHSKIAAYLMLKMDGEFALKKLDDDHVITLLRLMSEKTQESEKFAIDLLKQPRSDAVWKIAAATLYQYAGETIPEKNLYHMAMSRFTPGYEAADKPAAKKSIVKSNPQTTKSEKKSTKIAAVTKPAPATKKKDRLYIVQEGDNLWKISRRFGVDVDILKNHNKLKNNALKPGTTLRIP